MVFNPSLPPNHSKTTRILPLEAAAAASLALLKTYGTGPMPPNSPTQSAPAAPRFSARRAPPAPPRFSLALLVSLPRGDPRGDPYVGRGGVAPDVPKDSPFPGGAQRVCGWPIGAPPRRDHRLLA